MNIGSAWVRLVCLSVGALFLTSCRDPRQNPIGAGGGTNITASGGQAGGGRAGAATGGTGGGAIATGGAGGSATATGGQVGAAGGGPATGGAVASGGTAGAGGSRGASGGATGPAGSSGTDAGAPDASGLDGQPGCTATQKLCGNTCVDITDPKYGCGAASCDATACPNPGSGGTVVCQSGACVIGSCPTNFKTCGNKCVAVSDPTYGCGATTCDATACPAAGAGTLVCQSGACAIGSCGTGTKKCGDKCVTTDANNGCADSTRCTACASNETCKGSPTTCQCVATPMATACSGKCGSVSDGCGGTYTCGCVSPQTCGGGGTPNVCGCTKTPMTTVCSGSNCGSASDGCGGSYSCACGGGKACTNSSCACPSNAATVCGNCLASDFESSSDPSPWVRELDPNWTGGNGATNMAVTQTLSHGTGHSSLIVPILIDDATTYSAEVALSTPCKNDLAGFTLTAWVYLSGPPLDDFPKNLQIDTWDHSMGSASSGQGDYFVLYWSNIPVGSWFQITAMFVSAVPVDRVGIRLTPNTDWAGTMYVDDFVITGL